MVSQVNCFLSSIAFDQAFVSQRQKGNRIVDGQEMPCSHGLDGKGNLLQSFQGDHPELVVEWGVLESLMHSGNSWHQVWQ